MVAFLTLWCILHFRSLWFTEITVILSQSIIITVTLRTLCTAWHSTVFITLSTVIRSSTIIMTTSCGCNIKRWVGGLLVCLIHSEGPKSSNFLAVLHANCSWFVRRHSVMFVGTGISSHLQLSVTDLFFSCDYLLIWLAPHLAPILSSLERL